MEASPNGSATVQPRGLINTPPKRGVDFHLTGISARTIFEVTLGQGELTVPPEGQFPFLFNARLIALSSHPAKTKTVENQGQEH